jgi:hypothetical protein
VNTRREQAAETRLGTQSLDIMKFVNSRESTTPAELGAHLGIDNKVGGTLLGRLHDAGYIAKPSRGTYAPVCVESVENPGQGVDHSPGNSSLSTDSTPDNVRPLFIDTGADPMSRDRQKIAPPFRVIAATVDYRCPDCDNDIRQHQDGFGMWRLDVLHDDTCPTYRRLQATGQRPE